MPTVSTEDKPDARLATEAELKQFIDEVHPEDIDIESPEFRALPTEVQYEIVGDMRVRSRMTSTKRLADMLRAASSAIDFSMAQIKNLSQRNALTQQLYTVTDSVGSAHLKIPVRIAAERNREYVLVKRDEAQGGGWALGIREGSKQKPIEVEDDKPARGEVYSDSDSDYSDGHIQEVAPPPQPSRQTTDPDLREHRRREVLEAIAARYAPKKAPRASLDIEPKSFGKARLPGAMPLFESTEEDDEPEVVPSANDEALALALQQEELGSDEEEADLDLARALAISRKEADVRAMSVESIQSVTSEDSFEEVSLAPSAVPTPQNLSAQPTPVEIDITGEDEDEDMVEVEAPLAPSTYPPTKADQSIVPAQPRELNNQTSQFSRVIDNDHSAPPTTAPKSINLDEPHHVVSSPSDLQEVDQKLEAAFANSRSIHTQKPTDTRPSTNAEKPTIVEDDEDDFMEIIPSPVKPDVKSSTSTTRQEQPGSVAGPSRPRQNTTDGIPKNMRAGGSVPSPRPIQPERPSMNDDVASARPPLPRSLSRLSQRPSPALSRVSSARSISRTPAPEPEDPDNLSNSLLGIRATRPVDRHSYMEMAEESVPSSHQGSAYDGENNDSNDEDEDKEDDEDDQIEWSKSPSPGPVSRPPLHPAQSGETIPSEVEDDDEDMAPAEMVAEQDDYARFMASIRNRDLNEVRGEIDDEIRVLNNQNKVAMRDSDEITQAMVAQIQVYQIHISVREEADSRPYFDIMVYHTSLHPWKPKLNVPNLPN